LDLEVLLQQQHLRLGDKTEIHLHLDQFLVMVVVLVGLMGQNLREHPEVRVVEKKLEDLDLEIALHHILHLKEIPAVLMMAPVDTVVVVVEQVALEVMHHRQFLVSVVLVFKLLLLVQQRTLLV